MPDLRLRSAERRDARAIAGVHVRSWRAGYRGIIADDVLDSLSLRERERSWQGWLSNGRSATIVAQSQGRLVGFATISWPEGPRASVREIAALYVEPTMMRRGVGSALLSAAIEAARSDGCAEVVLWVLEANAAARAFYERAGFAPDGAREHHEEAASR